MESQVPERVDLVSGVHVHAALKCQLEEDMRRETDMRVLWLAEGVECAVGYWVVSLERLDQGGEEEQELQAQDASWSEFSGDPRGVNLSIFTSRLLRQVEGELPVSSVVLAAVFFVKTVQELHPDFHLSINNVHRVTLASFLAAVLWVQEAMQANARMFDDEDFQVMEHSVDLVSMVRSTPTEWWASWKGAQDEGAEESDLCHPWSAEKIHQMTSEFVFLLCCTNTGCPVSSTAGEDLRLPLNGPLSLSRVACSWSAFICSSVDSAMDLLTERLFPEGTAAQEEEEDGGEEQQQQQQQQQQEEEEEGEVMEID